MNLTFETKKAVRDFLRTIDGLEEGRNAFIGKVDYVLLYGEYSRPKYQPCKYKDGWGIHVERYYYADTLNCKKSGRVDAEDFMYRFEVAS